MKSSNENTMSYIYRGSTLVKHCLLHEKFIIGILLFVIEVMKTFPRQIILTGRIRYEKSQLDSYNF